MAIGASRTGIVRLFVFESLLVSLLAGIVGAVLAWQLVPLVPKMAANFLPFDPNTRVNLSFPVLGFTVGLSLLTGLLMGIYPALQSSHGDLVDGLKEGGRGVSGSVRQQRFRKILVGAQVALSVTLLAGAALLITSFIRLNQQNVGYQYRNVWIGFVTLPTAQYSDIGTRQRFVEQLLASLRAVPGFESVTVTGDIPLLVGGGNATLYSRADGEVLPVDKRATAPSHDVSPGYFKTWGIPVLAGRDFDEHDTADHQNVVLISQSGAKKVFGNENPIGKTLLVTSSGTPCEIVGIVGDVRSRKVNEPDDMEFYRPWAQENFPFPTIVVRSNLRADAVTKLVRSTLATVDPGLAIALPQSMETDHRTSPWPDAADDLAARNFCGRCFVARSNRDLWRSRIHGRATHRRDRRADGARRPNARCAAAHPEPGNETGCDRTRDRDRVSIRARALDCVAIV